MAIISSVVLRSAWVEPDQNVRAAMWQPLLIFLKGKQRTLRSTLEWKSYIKQRFQIHGTLMHVPSTTLMARTILMMTKMKQKNQSRKERQREHMQRTLLFRQMLIESSCSFSNWAVMARHCKVTLPFSSFYLLFPYRYGS